MVTVSQRGYMDWLIQRFSAVYMFLCVVALAVFFIKHPDLNYFEWQNLFSSLSTKVIAAVFVLSLLMHTWIGIWTVITDYVKIGLLRLILNVFILFALVGFFFAALLILWSV